MKLQLLAVVSLLCPPSAANYSRRHSRTLSATVKKPASLAGFLSRRLYMTRLIAHFLPCCRASSTSRSLKLITQTPNSL